MQKISFSLPVTVIKEGDNFVAYTPALDLSTVGKTFDEAKKRFEEAVQIFFEEIIEKGTMGEALSELGWEKINHQYVPPVVVGHDTETFTIQHPL